MLATDVLLYMVVAMTLNEDTEQKHTHHLRYDILIAQLVTR